MVGIMEAMDMEDTVTGMDTGMEAMDMVGIMEAMDMVGIMEAMDMVGIMAGMGMKAMDTAGADSTPRLLIKLELQYREMKYPRIFFLSGNFKQTTNGEVHTWINTFLCQLHFTFLHDHKFLSYCY